MPRISLILLANKCKHFVKIAFDPAAFLGSRGFLIAISIETERHVTRPASFRLGFKTEAGALLRPSHLYLNVSVFLS